MTAKGCSPMPQKRCFPQAPTPTDEELLAKKGRRYSTTFSISGGHLQKWGRIAKSGVGMTCAFTNGRAAVIDASVMLPRIVSANTARPTVMIAEKSGRILILRGSRAPVIARPPYFYEQTVIARAKGN